ncbi:MAG: 4Fe-4S dicluster domain-containing protein [Candidatus Poribacteria bacterium]|nr:4Fe-4S dicluster domain-containing protein [Candidatus Poribacteria bacterium]
MAKSDDEYGRRSFFREAFTRLVQPVAEYVDTQVEAYLPVSPSEKALLRPPGALPEETFLNTCLRSGHCVDSCPANAIQILQRTDPHLANTPYIDPDHQPCVVCDSLECMQVCPSGALQKLTADEIQIGLAEVSYDTCLRSREIDCRYCIDACPMGEKAIRLDSQRRVEVLPSGCVGCGVCQHRCPTAPKSIIVRPLVVN